MRPTRLLSRSFFAILAFLLVFTYSFGLTGAKTASAASDVDVNADAAILVDFNSGKILFEKNAEKMLPPASMSKVMVEYLVMKAIDEGKIDWDTKVRISDYVRFISEQLQTLSNVPLRQDRTYTVKDLYEGMSIYSANGATIALAELLGNGSEKRFVQMMNKQAEKFGMKAHYVNSTGLNNADLGQYASVGGKNDENMLTAKSQAILAYHLIKDYPEALKYASIPNKKFEPATGNFNMRNYNEMLPGMPYEYQGVDGLKTGHTSLAGYCFTGTVKRDGQRFISVVFGTDSNAARFKETAKLFDYGFNNYKPEQLVKEGQTFKKNETLPVVKGKEDSVKIAAANSVSMPVRVGEEKNYKTEVHLDKSKLNKDGELEAPVKKGAKVGYVTVEYSGKGQEYGYLLDQNKKIPLVTTEKVDKANWFMLMLHGIGSFFANIFSGIGNMIKGWF